MCSKKGERPGLNAGRCPWVARGERTRKAPAGGRKGGAAWLRLKGGKRQSMSQALFDVLFDHSYPLNFQIIRAC